MSARIVEAERTSENSRSRRFFVKSATEAGVWWRCDYTPGESLTCSCPYSRRHALDPNAPSCWHQRAVTKRMVADAQAVA